MEALLALIGDGVPDDTQAIPSSNPDATSASATTAHSPAAHPLAKLLNLLPDSSHQGVTNALFVVGKVNEAAAKAKAEAMAAAEAAAAAALTDIASYFPPHYESSSKDNQLQTLSNSKSSSYTVTMVPPEPICNTLRTPAAVHQSPEEMVDDDDDEEEDGAKSRRVSSRKKSRGGWKRKEMYSDHEAMCEVKNIDKEDHQVKNIDKVEDQVKNIDKEEDRSDEEKKGRRKRGGGRTLSTKQEKNQLNKQRISILRVLLQAADEKRLQEVEAGARYEREVKAARENREGENERENRDEVKKHKASSKVKQREDAVGAAEDKEKEKEQKGGYVAPPPPPPPRPRPRLPSATCSIKKPNKGFIEQNSEDDEDYYYAIRRSRSKKKKRIPQAILLALQQQRAKREAETREARGSETESEGKEEEEDGAGVKGAGGGLGLGQEGYLVLALPLISPPDELPRIRLGVKSEPSGKTPAPLPPVAPSPGNEEEEKPADEVEGEEEEEEDGERNEQDLNRAIPRIPIGLERGRVPVVREGRKRRLDVPPIASASDPSGPRVSRRIAAAAAASTAAAASAAAAAAAASLAILCSQPSTLGLPSCPPLASTKAPHLPLVSSPSLPAPLRSLRLPPSSSTISHAVNLNSNSNPNQGHRAPSSRVPNQRLNLRAPREIPGVELIEPEPLEENERVPTVVLANRFRPLNKQLYADVTIVSPRVADIHPGDVLRSALSWFKEAAAGHEREDYDDHMHTSYEHRYMEIALRLRRSIQKFDLDPSDPMADPENYPGERPLTKEERLIAFLDMFDGDGQEGSPQAPSPALQSPQSLGHRNPPPLAAGPHPSRHELGHKEGASLLLGPSYQARVPLEAPQRVKGELTKEERQVMGEVVQLGGKHRPAGLGEKGFSSSSILEMRESCMEGLSASLDLQSRHAVMDSTIREMDAEVLGPGDVRALGMHLLGSKARSLWVEKDEAAFANGIRKHDREFELIQRDFLPHKTMSDLIAYYYNVWKIRYTTAADTHHLARRAKKDKAQTKMASP